MALKVKQGYLGFLSIEGLIIRCTDFNVNLDQTPQWYDHTLGLRDNLTTSIHATKGDTGQSNVQKHTWRASTKMVRGQISFPLADINGDPFFEKAKTGENFDFIFKYSCGIARSFFSCKVNSWSMNISASDIVQITVEVWALEITEGTMDALYTEPEKLVTWDTFLLTIDGYDATSGLANFEVSINNNLIPIYTAGINTSLNLRSSKFRVGMQEVSGTMGVYGDAFSLFSPLEIDTGHNITINVGAGLQSLTLNVLYMPIKRQGQVGTLIHTVQFEGVWSGDEKAIT